VLADHNLVSADANGILGGLRWVERASDLGSLGADLLSGRDDAPGGRAFGETVTDHRSSWVRAAEWSGRPCYFKTYDYPSREDRLRGLGRTTALAPSRARREWAAIRWLATHGFATVTPLGVVEARPGLFLRRAVIATTAYGGPDLRWWLGPDGEAEPDEVLDALRGFVEALHGAGFHDRNLDPRNVLARRDDRGRLVLTKIDSPRFVLARPGSRRSQRLAALDRERLHRGLHELGVDFD
jgi:hypothetical protein